MRLPNNFGSVVKLSGNRRRPFWARKTVGYNNKKHPIFLTIGYFFTREDGIQALVDYNRQKTIYSPGITLSSLYRLWLPTHINKVGSSAIDGYKTSYSHLKPIIGIPLESLKFSDIQSCFDAMTNLNYASKKKSRTLLNLLFNYAFTHEYIDTNPHYGKLLDIGKNIPCKPHKRFTRQQINKVWNCTLPEKNIVLILLYSGMRISELLHLKKSDVKIRAKYFDIKKSKTKSSIRVIPIHDRIYPIVHNLMNTDSKYLIPDCQSYSRGAARFNKVMKHLHMNHTSHDCRHTVRSILNEKDANQAAIDRLLGHCSSNIGDAVYTHVRLPQLRKTLRLLP